MKLFLLLILLCSQSFAAWTFKQGATGASALNPAPAAIFSSNLTNPSLIIIFVINTSHNTIAATPTDTAGHTFIDSGCGKVAYNTSARAVQMYYALNTSTTAANTFSISNAALDVMSIDAMEFTGHSLTLPLQGCSASPNNSNSGVGGGQNITSGAFVTTIDGDLIIGDENNISGSITVGTGFTFGSASRMEYLVQSTAGSRAATWSSSSNNDNYGAIMMAFRVPALQATTQIGAFSVGP